jgi:small-conductance mechanosensitive channel
LSESQSIPDQETSARIASSFAQAFAELQDAVISSSGISAATSELASARAAINQLARRVESQLEEDKEQRRQLGDQLSSLANSLDRLVTHLQGLSQLMGDLLERLAEPQGGQAAQAPAETPFRPGPDGLSLTLTGLPGFQALMEVQKAISAMEQVAGASVERYQEGDSRLLVHLTAPVTATEIADWLRKSTPYTPAVEESKPELSRLRMRVAPA